MKKLRHCISMGIIALFGCLTEADDTLPTVGNQRSLIEQPPPPQGNTPEVEPQPQQGEPQPQTPMQPIGQEEPTGSNEDFLPPQGNPTKADLNPKEAVLAQPNGDTQEQGCSLLSSKKNSPPINKDDSVAIQSTTIPKYPENKILIEIVRHSPEEGNIALYNFSCTPSEAFQYNLPSNIGPVYAIYFLDENGGGPSKQEILGRSPLIDPNQKESLSFSVKIEKNADLSPLNLFFEPKAMPKEYDLPNPIAEPDANLPPPLAEPEANLPPPLAEPEANLPPAKKRSDRP